jgi:acetolactate synthase I/II/III large subunit
VLTRPTIQFSADYYQQALEALSRAKRPLIVAGAGIHLANCEEAFSDLVQKAQIPVVSTWNASDLFAHDSPLYVGNFGLLGERAANLAIQNADVILVLGSRLSIPSIGYATDLFAPAATKIMVDIDPDEIGKVSLSIDIPLVADLRDIVPKLACDIAKKPPHAQRWQSTLSTWKARFNVFDEPHQRAEGKVNSYDFMAALSESLASNDVVVTDMGTSFTCTMQALRNNGKNRLFTSSACCPMGFGLPGSIGAYFANKKNRVICIAGDGGFQMNLQELQAVVHHKIPLKIFILNSSGYLAISIMQDNLFGGKRFGSTPESGVSAPEFHKLATAYGIPSVKVTSLESLKSLALDCAFSNDDPLLCEIHMPNTQLMIPRVQSTKDADGKIVSGGIDKMFPYLSQTQWDQVERDLSEI